LILKAGVAANRVSEPQDLRRSRDCNSPEGEFQFLFAAIRLDTVHHLKKRLDVLDRLLDRRHDGGMGTMRHITADVPEDLLREAMGVTNKGVSETLIEGLELVRRTRAYQKAIALRGKLDLDLDLDVSRERADR